MRRLLIFGIAAVVYAALLSVTWIIGTRQAWEQTEWQLDYGVMDVHDTVAGAIDTMLGHVARTAVRHLESPRPFSMDRMCDGAKELDIDEVNVVDRTGRIIASNDPHCMNVEMAGDPVMDEFMQLTNGTVATVSQPFRPHARNPEFRAKYLAAAFPGGNGFVQVGLDERRLARMLPSILGYIFDQWLFGRTGFFLCVDRSTGRLISNPSRHKDEASTLLETGYDPATARQYEFVADGKSYGKTFVQVLFGETCHCRAFRFGGHLFIAALPLREFYATRNIIVAVLGVLLFFIIAAFAFFADRIFRDSDSLKAFYAADESRRAKDMEIAKTIQASALLVAAPENPSYGISAAMTPARDVGGDFYDYFPIDSSHVAFIVADVSGKGITAALYMMRAKTMIKDTLLSVRDPAEALDKVNAELCQHNTANMFLTAWVGVLDLETGLVEFANAGHNPPAKIGESGVSFIEEKSGPVLAFLDGFKYARRTLRLAPGDALFLYTDGVTEAVDSNGSLFGEQRLSEALAAAPKGDAEHLCKVVRAVVSAFSEGVAQADDITVLALRYIAPPRGYLRTFPPTKEGVAQASAYLDEIEAKENIAPVSPALHIILDEICSNIVKHSGASGFEVDVGMNSSPAYVKMTFIDDGRAYDPLAHVDPDITLPAEERGIGGLGIMMVKKMADSVSYRRAHNRNFLEIVKKLPES